MRHLPGLSAPNKEQSSILIYLKVYPLFDPLRGDPRFKDIVRRVGLT
jgi:hypothetical protein